MATQTDIWVFAFCSDPASHPGDQEQGQAAKINRAQGLNVMQCSRWQKADASKQTLFLSQRRLRKTEAGGMPAHVLKARRVSSPLILQTNEHVEVLEEYLLFTGWRPSVHLSARLGSDEILA